MLQKLVPAVGGEPAYPVSLRRRLHTRPELGGLEVDTARLIAAALPVCACFIGGTTDPAASVGGAGPGVLIRAETDGIELTEETGVPCASANGRMPDARLWPRRADPAPATAGGEDAADVSARATAGELVLPGPVRPYAGGLLEGPRSSLGGEVGTGARSL